MGIWVPVKGLGMRSAGAASEDALEGNLDSLTLAFQWLVSGDGWSAKVAGAFVWQGSN